MVFRGDHQPTPPWKAAEDPNSAGDKRPESKSPGAAHALSSAPPNGKGCILIVDDDEAVRETLAELLEIVGFNPVQAGDAAEALAILRQEPNIDAMVTDLTMPGEDGIALIRHARELNSGLPAILLTGYAEQTTSVATIAGGNFHVLRKPVESDRLIQELELLLAKPGA